MMHKIMSFCLILFATMFHLFCKNARKQPLLAPKAKSETNGKPIYIIAKTNSDISTTMANIATEIIFYDKPEDLVEPFKRIVNNFPRVILASKSAVRKQQLIDESIPFEVLVSNADESPDNTKSFKDQLAEIAMRKTQTIFEKTKDRGLRLIVGADQNIFFDGKMYGKPKNINEDPDEK